MNEHDRHPDAAQGGYMPASRPGNSFEQKQQPKTAATASLSGAADAVKQEAMQLGREAGDMAAKQTDKAKEAAVSHLDSFADALRAASEKLGRDHSDPASELVANAASGLEKLSRSLHGSSTGDIVNTVRRFGRENPMGFLAGSVLAGFALGRFAAAATTDASASAQETAATYPATPAPSATRNASPQSSGGFRDDA